MGVISRLGLAVAAGGKAGTVDEGAAVRVGLGGWVACGAVMGAQAERISMALSSRQGSSLDGSKVW